MFQFVIRNNYYSDVLAYGMVRNSKEFIKCKRLLFV
jgi:hypothetical protein